LPRAGKVWLEHHLSSSSHSALERYSGGRPVPRAQSFPTAGTYKHADVYMSVRELPFFFALLLPVQTTKSRLSDLHPIRVVVELSFRRRFHPCDL